AVGDLPPGVTPVLNPETTPLGEIYQFRMVSDRHDQYDLRAELQWTATRVLKQVQGVGDVVSFGGFLKEVHVQVDPAKLYAAGLTLADLTTAVSKANVNVGGGFLRHGDQELTVRGVGYIESPDDIKRIVLKSRQGTAGTVGDVAELVLASTP